MNEELIKRLRKIGDRVPAPCPDGIKGCLVFHFSVETDPTCAEAADTIEAQAAEIKRLREALILRGVGKINGDGWKDVTKQGEVVYVWNTPLEPPFAEGQYPRVGCEGWSASVRQYDFFPATVEDVAAIRAALGEAE
jgi:hypothetical protein